MNTNFFGFIAIVVLLFLSSCDVLQQVGNEVVAATDNSTQNNSLTQQEVVRGLKEALRISTDTAVAIVSKPNGFFADALIKISLPPQAQGIIKNKDNAILKSMGISTKIDEVVLRLNRAAESASKEATPIFIDAIKNMNIADAFALLKGSDTAATHYFREKSYGALYVKFKPIINQYLNTDLVGGISTNQAWNNLTKVYNQAARFSTGLTPINTQLDDYATKKAIDGLFVKLAAQEKQIRKNPIARVNDILKRVFGVKS